MWIVITIVSALTLYNLYKMATFQDIKDAVTALAAARATEKAAVAAATAALQQTVTDLQALVASAPSPTDFQGVVDEINVVITDLKGTA